MGDRSQSTLKGRLRSSRSRVDLKEAKYDKVQLGSTVELAATTKRQIDLEKRRTQHSCRDERRSDTCHGCFASIAHQRPGTGDSEQFLLDEDVWDILGNTEKSVKTHSNSVDSSVERSYVARLAALVPNGPPDGRFTKARLDPGCSLSLISMKLVNRWKLKNLVDTVNDVIDLRGICPYSEKTNRRIKLSFRFASFPREFRIDFWILEKEVMMNDIVLGRLFLEKQLRMKTNKTWKAITGPPLGKEKGFQRSSAADRRQDTVIRGSLARRSSKEQ